MDLPVGESYEAICSKFKWDIPEYFNIADVVCDRWAKDAGRIAITHESLDGSVRDFTFAEVKSHSNQLANLLGSLGLVVCPVAAPKAESEALRKAASMPGSVSGSVMT